MRSKKKRIIFCIVVAVVVILAVVLAFLMGEEENTSNQYHESERQDTVVYEGKEYRYNEHLSNFLFMGIDTRESLENEQGIGEGGHADTIFLLSLDRVNGKASVFSIPRDTMTNIRILAANGEDMGLARNQITMQYTFGDGKWKSCDLMKETVSQLFYGIPIQGYCAMNMEGISVATDLLGGVELLIEDELFAEIDSSYQKGSIVTINGENAERIVRYRDKGQTNSALDRMHRQMALLEAFVGKAREKSNSDEKFIAEMLEGVEGYMISNIGSDMYAKMLEASFTSEDVTAIPGEGMAGEIYDEFHVDDEKMYKLVIETFYEEVQ